MNLLGITRSSSRYIFIVISSFVAGLITILVLVECNAATRFLIAMGVPFGLIFLTSLPTATRKLKRVISQFQWYHLLWLFVFLSGLVFRMRSAETVRVNPLDFWAISRIVLMGLVGFILLGRLATQRTEWIRSIFQGLIGLMTAYSLICVISSLWSVYPAWTLYKSIEYLVDIVLIGAIVCSVRTVWEYKTLFDLTIVLLVLLIATVWAGILIWPEEAIKHGVGVIGIQVRGVVPAIANNRVGQLGALISIVSLTRLLFPLEQKRFYFAFLITGMVVLLISQSRSALMGFFVALPLVLFATRKIRSIVFFALVIPLVLILTNTDDLLWQFFLRGHGPEQFASLSGRVYWWEYGWEQFKNKPLIGYGAYAGARFAVLANLGFLFTSSIHNTWLETIFGTGISGICVLLAAFVGVWIFFLRHSTNMGNGTLVHRLSAESIGILGVLSVRTMFTSELIWHPPLLFLLVLGYAEFLRRKFKKRKEPEPTANAGERNEEKND